MKYLVLDNQVIATADDEYINTLIVLNRDQYPNAKILDEMPAIPGTTPPIPAEDQPTTTGTQEI